MELRHLRYFIAVAETGSLTEAAKRRLYTSQPSLSRQIRILKTRWGSILLTRGVRGVELTAAGKAFLDHARLALMQVDATIEAARRAARPARKTFNIGFQTGHERNWLPRAMHVLHDQLTNIQVVVSSAYSPDLAEALAPRPDGRGLHAVRTPTTGARRSSNSPPRVGACSSPPPTPSTASWRIGSDQRSLRARCNSSTAL